MRLTEWLASKNLVKAANKLRTDETFALLVQMLEDESPLNLPLASQGPSADDRSYRLGLIEGYNDCLRKIRASWTMRQEPKQIKATYAPAEE